MNEVRVAPTNPLLLIPARMRSARLPGKPLADICGLPMVVHVWQRAVEAKLGKVVVAASDPEIVAAVEKAGGEAVLTDPDLPTGSDRIYRALLKCDPEKKVDCVINVQGDEPLQAPSNIRRVFELLQDVKVDIATCVAHLADPARRAWPQVVKVALELNEKEKKGRCLYFSRAEIPAGDGPCFQHIGLYAYRRDALERFVKSPQGIVEKRESLEQLRALALGMHVEAALVDDVASGVDTPEDLQRAREEMARRMKA